MPAHTMEKIRVVGTAVLEPLMEDIAIQQLTLNPPTENSKGLRIGNFVQIRDVVDEELEAVWAGTKTAKQALDSAVERGNKLLRDFEAANK